jgi:hypothetical protein
MFIPRHLSEVEAIANVLVPKYSQQIGMSADQGLKLE